ncbi:MAG: PAS domain S-box protein [Burkholderiaceae bacterium]
MNDGSFALIEDPRELLATIVASTDDVVLSKTLDGVITSWNAAAERTFGYSAAEAIGQSIKLIIPPDRHAEEDDILARIRRGERVDHFETVRVTRSGRCVDFSVTVSPLRNRAGVVVGASKVGRDITATKAAQRAAETAQQILQLIADNAPLLVGYVDKDCIYQLVGRRHEEWLGRPRDQILGRHARDVVGPAAWERLRPKVEEALPGHIVSFEMEVPLRDGGLRWVDVSYIPHFDASGTVVGFAVLTNDVDERRRTEDAQRLLVSLDDATRGLDDPHEVMQRIVTQVGRHFGAIRCAYGEVDSDARMVEIIRGYTDDVPTVAGRYPLARFGAAFAEALLAGDVAAVNDVRSDPRMAEPAAQATFDAMQIRSLLVAPIRRGAQVVALLVVADRTPRVWSRQQIGLLGQIAQRTYFALATAQAIADLRESEQVLSLASRAGRMGAWWRDVTTDRVWWSAEMEEIFGLSPGGFQALGGSEGAFFDLVHPEDRPRVAADIADAMKARVDYRVDFRFRHASGEWRWMEGRGQGYFDEQGELVTMYGVGIDVTERKRDEEVLRRQATELADADRRKDEFLAMLAHELRNPLAPIRNSLQYLQLKGPDTAELQSARDIIDRQVRQLVRLVDDLLDVSRISRGKIDLQRQRINLNMVVESAVESSRPLIDANDHCLVVRLPASPVEIDADMTRLVQVLQNLLNNAAKYTPHGGRIELSAAVEAGEVVIRVCDNGIGIPPDLVNRVFEMFMQLDRRIERSSGGLGIGLTLVQRLVELHGGRVEAFSEGPGRGSTFVVHLPLPSAAALRGPLRVAAAPEARRPVKVLIVDDNRDGADSLAMTLTALGHLVRVEYDGRLGVEAAAAWKPDIALLDIGLPGINGYEVARSLRLAEATRDTVLVAVTGWGQPEDRRRSAQAGFDHHLVKPVDPLHLRVLLNAVGARAPAVSGEVAER